MSRRTSPGNAGRSPRPRTAFRSTIALGAAVAVAGGLAAAVPASADDNRLTVRAAKDRDCTAPAKGAGVDSWTVTAPVSGLVEAKVDGSGDWDLAVLDPAGEAVAASAGFGGREVATGFVEAGTELTVQGCLLSGKAGSVLVDLTFLEIQGEPETTSLVEVHTPERADKDRLTQLPLDLTEHATPTTVAVVLHGEEDAQLLRDNGFTWDTEVADMAAQSRADRAADAAFSAAVDESALPSGRTTYRRLADYEAEMKALAEQYPDMVKPLTLAEPTVEGRMVHGIEIATDVHRVNDGKPIHLNMGAHHAREWPSAEHSMEWAYELINGYGTDPELTELLDEVRVVVVPVINPDGFTISREAPTTDEFGLFSYDMKRKNCSVSEYTPEQYRVGTCADNPAGRLRGTDLNRNYGGFWGGPGASPTWSNDTYRGDGPFSEPETRNVKQLVGTRSVTTLITNHTYSNLWLRPPGVAATRPPLEEPMYAALGAAATSHNGYANIPSYELYDTTGGTEDWTFWTAGGLGFTPEIGDEGFHPAYERAVVAEYMGLEPAAGAGLGGNSAAYREILRATADPAYHSRITGVAPAGHTITVSKEFTTETSPVVQTDGTVGEPIRFEDSLEATFDSRGGKFSFAVNPSTRPVVAGRFGREPTGPAQDALALVNPDGIPEENKALDFDGPKEVATFTVEEGYDNAFATVELDWGSADAADWDMYVLNSDGDVVASAATGDEPERATLRDPVPGEYTVYVFNYDQTDPANPDDWTAGVTFRGPDPMVIGEKEAWVMTCETRTGRVVSVREVVVDRGEAVDVGPACRPQRKPRS
ncbi:M14 family zinc carboxypeptidase [Thalassiella azotivora]